MAGVPPGSWPVYGGLGDGVRFVYLIPGPLPVVTVRPGQGADLRNSELRGDALNFEEAAFRS